MQRSRSTATPRLPWHANRHPAAFIAVLGVWAALALAVFYHGPQIPLLVGAEAVLVVWLAASIWRRYDRGIGLPRTPFTVSLTLFWCWLGATLMWTPVPATSAISVWWVGSVALTFWAYTLAPDRARVWQRGAPLVLGGALLLCGYALTQMLVWGEPPRATFINIHSFAALMVLVSFPLAARLLVVLQKPRSRVQSWTLAAPLFLLWFTVAATKGRGTTLALVFGLLALTLLTWRDVPRRHLAMVIALCAAAYAAANVLLQGALADRFATLGDPASAAIPRLLIWRGSWEMVKDNPWFGIGVGNYYLAWPRYRDPADTTLGFFAHNDYLQIWIEAGLPALLLLLAVCVAVGRQTIQVLGTRRVTASGRIEIVGLASGLATVAAHSVVDFNLYVLPISITAGLMLGRWHERVARAAVSVPMLRVSPRRHVRWPVYRGIVALAALIPLWYLAALAASDIFFERAVALAAQGQFQQSDDYLFRAEQLLPTNDRYYVAHADLLRYVLTRTPVRETDQRRALYREALELLDRAQASNPYRALVHDIRGRLHRDAADIAGADWRALARQEFQRALTKDPRLLRTRLVYAQLLESGGDGAGMRALLEDGARYWYSPEPVAIDYYDWLARLHRDDGRPERAADFEARRHALAARAAPPRSLVRDVDITPATASTAIDSLAR